MNITYHSGKDNKLWFRIINKKYCVFRKPILSNSQTYYALVLDIFMLNYNVSLKNYYFIISYSNKEITSHL